ncbi:MAG: hypothetical protein ABI651_07545 [Verrucomicrobiota bacterium]
MSKPWRISRITGTKCATGNIKPNQGLFIGSGVVEAGCKTVIGKRLKQTGMFWELSGAHNILDIRCVLENDDFDRFWEKRSTTPNPLAKAA